MKKIILNTLTPFALGCMFIMLLLYAFSLFAGDYAQTFAAYLGGWAPTWILSAVTFLLFVSVVVLIAEKTWLLGWVVLIIANTISLYAFIVEHYVLVSPMPDWERGVVMGDYCAFILTIILEVCAIASLAVNIFMPRT